MNGDGDKTTSQSCNLNGDEPKGIRKGALLLCLGTPSQWPPLYFLLVNRILAKETFSMPKTRQSRNNRWGWRFLPSPLEFTEPLFLQSNNHKQWIRPLFLLLRLF